jgi:hypothetical protein
MMICPFAHAGGKVLEEEEEEEGLHARCGTWSSFAVMYV